jgi:two-component system cell cycle response regulator
VQSAEPKRPSVLIVDDQIANLRLLSDTLKERGFTVRQVTSGPLALKSIAASAPDILLLDINMPGMNGYRVCELLKRHQEHRIIPVIFLSAMTAAEDIAQAYHSGGADYIPKPFRLEEVEARIRTQLMIRDQGRRLTMATQSLRRASASYKRIVQIAGELPKATAELCEQLQQTADLLPEGAEAEAALQLAQIQADALRTQVDDLRRACDPRNP